MDQESISRYSRQLIMPEIGVKGQLKLKDSSILIIGAGGLGCPAIQYLVAAGIGQIGIVDYDEVELSNLHRQILHTETKAERKMRKTSSAAEAALQLNSKVKVDEYCLQLDRENALGIVGKYDVVLDATDNVPSRYLINDVCVVLNKPLVSGSALRWEGQLTTYHFHNKEENTYGPCYRCLYPKPPPPETVTNCSDGGVIGVIPGIIGCMQSLEAIKIIVGVSPSYNQKLLVFDGLYGAFRTIKLRGAQETCAVCGKDPSITANNLPNYEEFCGTAATDKCLKLNILNSEERISAMEYKDLYVDRKKPHVLVDVRSEIEIEICALPNSINVPIKVFERCQRIVKGGNNVNVKELNTRLDKAVQDAEVKDDEKLQVFVVCRLGNDSQKAVEIMKKHVTLPSNINVRDIKGGLLAWSNSVDKSFPRY
uniref:adenylyltransferase and sulfurtransferase MOCS3 n=1 Tax=Ciona intestinalis TaxID=7719 RepID=UPI000180D13B|nr:adenylyltransferase and sulfurtransferase MOCS3 [Ciona intestinalis]|eukprot:XP_004226357.1 adenylyltransferase and sulfurtransferase MOCS3 [Ciona intestinalis]